jgi:exonuclease III
MFKPDIVLINELKLDENFFLRFEGYNTYDKPRNQFGGGVAIVIKSAISQTQTNEFDDLNLELVSIKINCKKFGDVQIVTYYNPPSSTLSLELFCRLSYSKLSKAVT